MTTTTKPRHQINISTPERFGRVALGGIAAVVGAMVIAVVVVVLSR